MNHYYTHFDALWNEWAKGFELTPHSKECVSLPKYPVSNCYLSEDQNTLHFEFALAGYAEKEIKVIGGKNSFTVRASKEEDLKAHMLLHHGISGRDVDFSIKVDEQYDSKKAKVAYKDGLLCVTIPKAKEAESVLLFG
jgi:HSP20 family molecular chaperone IbpA